MTFLVVCVFDIDGLLWNVWKNDREESVPQVEHLKKGRFLIHQFLGNVGVIECVF